MHKLNLFNSYNVSLTCTSRSSPAFVAKCTIDEEN